VVAGIDGEFLIKVNGKPFADEQRTSIIIPCTATFQSRSINLRLGFAWDARAKRHPLYPLYERLKTEEEPVGNWYKVEGTYMQTNWAQT
ncbi:hypothetical protein BG000_005822, partial [Podila horticola]